MRAQTRAVQTCRPDRCLLMAPDPTGLCGNVGAGGPARDTGTPDGRRQVRPARRGHGSQHTTAQPACACPATQPPTLPQTAPVKTARRHPSPRVAWRPVADTASPTVSRPSGAQPAPVRSAATVVRPPTAPVRHRNAGCGRRSRPPDPRTVRHLQAARRTGRPSRLRRHAHRKGGSGREDVAGRPRCGTCSHQATPPQGNAPRGSQASGRRAAQPPVAYPLRAVSRRHRSAV